MLKLDLRSGNNYEPWPEEVNRKIITQIADQHFAPTARAADILRKENVRADQIYVTGNTIIDALLASKSMMSANPGLSVLGPKLVERYKGRRIILATCHRRENFGDRMTHIGDAFERILERPDVALVLPIHPNPNVRDVLGARLSSHPRAEVIPPQEYLDFVGLLSAANIVLTDSGGVQEEAPALGKPVLVMRETTERPEGVEAGTARLVGADADRIVSEVNRLLDDPNHYQAMARAHNPFGDGHASERIVRIICTMIAMPKVSVIGLGYIGLPTAALIASRGINVLGVDINEHIVSTIAAGSIHIAEPDLDGLVQKVVSNGMLRVSNKAEPADVFIIAVPTPMDEEKRPELHSVFAAVEGLYDVLRPGNLLILESTSPIGTTEEIAKRIFEKRPDLKLGAGDKSAKALSIAYCPERVLPGRILSELINNDRCIGGITSNCARQAQRFYKLFVRGACITTSARAAEMVKLTENAFRDTNIAFANELSLICDRFAINVWEVIDLANRHPRVNILRPGPGVGGHCIAIDPWFIVHSAPDLARVIRTSREVNDSKIGATVERAVALIEENSFASVACLGFAFKANVDDLRESPAMEVAKQLSERYGARIKIVEPNIRELPRVLAHCGAEFVDIDDAIKNCEVAIVLVDHDQFKMIPLADRRHLAVLDTRGIWQDMLHRDFSNSGSSA